MSQFEFIVPGKPQAQGRPRFFRRGGFVGVYDPKESKDFKAKVALHAKVAGAQLMIGLISIKITFYLPRPKALCRKSDPELPIYCGVKPDWENLAKSICDALNGVCYKDDGQICRADIMKYYHEKVGVPRTVVAIYGTNEGAI